MENILSLVAVKDTSSVYINEALDSRAVVGGNLADEKRALHALAATMAERPAEILPKFVELAMTLTGSASAGLSLYESEPAPGVFRWRHLHGDLAPFENATTPRNDSPCGVTLDRDSPTLSAHPELVYDWISAENLIVPEVLLVPLRVGGEAVGTLWVVAPHEEHFHRGHAETTAELASFASLALKMVREEERLRAALEEQELVAKEMSHRLKNLFSMTDGMIRGSARSASTVEELVEALSGRVHAMADAHSLVQRRVAALGSDKVFDLAELIATVLKVHDRPGDGAGRISVQGPSVPCGDHATNLIALMIHELATNAVKYGALSLLGGRVDIGWEIEGDRLAMRWREHGGPLVAGEPSRRGFGSSLIAMTVERHFQGSIAYDWQPSGLEVDIRMGLSKLGD